MFSTLFTLLDDVIAVMDDVAALTKVATKKTAGVLGDDLALNAEQVSGLSPDRETPVVLAVAWRSLGNKAVLVPVALALSAFLPWAVGPLLLVGGLYLCFEGAEKVLHRRGPEQTSTRPAASEAERIKGAVRTDFILSAELIVIALGSVASAPWPQRVLTLVAVSLLMTVGVYGLVLGIVKLDDLGLALRRRGPPWLGLGDLLLRTAPLLLRVLAFAGTVAMFLVGGGIITHAWPALEALGGSSVLAQSAIDGLTGFVCGAVLVAVVAALQRLRGVAPA